MASTLNTSTLVSVDQQLIGISTIFKEIHAYLNQYRPAFIPESVYMAVAEMSRELPTLQKQIQALEGEWRSLRALALIGQVINSSLDLDEVLQIVMDNIVRLTGAERGFLMLREETGEMIVRVARNWEQESIEPDEFAISRTIIHRVVIDRPARPHHQCPGRPALWRARKASSPTTCARSLCVPLKVKEDLIGVIYADNRIRTGIFTEPPTRPADRFCQPGRHRHRKCSPVRLGPPHPGRSDRAEEPDG